ncbi:hypothetical protein MASR1M50_17150 [Burkholderiales bacterium]
MPLLSSIPVVGALFGRHRNTADRTELLVILTPRVLRSDEDARAVSRELRDRMQGLMQGGAPAARAGAALSSPAGVACLPHRFIAVSRSFVPCKQVLCSRSGAVSRLPACSPRAHWRWPVARRCSRSRQKASSPSESSSAGPP